jgi:hypothetical protein
MSDGLAPTSDFDWLLVEWRGPKQTVARSCSYCRESLGDPEDEGYQIPLMLWNEDGWAARFCVSCQRKYWGFRCLGDDNDRPGARA